MPARLASQGGHNPTNLASPIEGRTLMLRVFLLVAALLFAAPTVAGTPGHQPFDDTAALDTTQVIDSRGQYGELVCRAGDTVPEDCEIDYHPADET